MPTNHEIRDAGLSFAKNYMENEGYAVETSRRNGCDYEISKENILFFVLVKSTEKEKFTQRWLESSQEELCNECPDKFLLFLVKNSPASPEIYGIFPGSCLNKRKRNLVLHQFYDVSNPKTFNL